MLEILFKYPLLNMYTGWGWDGGTGSQLKGEEVEANSLTSISPISPSIGFSLLADFVRNMLQVWTDSTEVFL